MKKRVIVVMSVLLTLLLGVTSNASAGGPTLVTGTQRLLNDVLGWLVGLEVIITTVLAVWRGILWQKAEEEEKLRARKSFTGVLIVGVVVITITALVPFIFSYYQ